MSDTDASIEPLAGDAPRAGGGEDEEDLLNRLLYKGVLPRYAFPIDVATFYVFDVDRSRPKRPAFRHTPQQALAVALSQYAPGREVWIANQRYISGALYSPYRDERWRAWERRRLYFECEHCGYAVAVKLSEGEKGELRTCPACRTEGSLGPARYWLRPPGFAHPVEMEVGTDPGEMAPISYPTRAKLQAPTTEHDKRWRSITENVRVRDIRDHLLVTNAGPRKEGYSYCHLCGIIEPTALPNGRTGGAHRKPYPDAREPNCPGGKTSSGICLGTDFITDVLLLEIRTVEPVKLLPGVLATEVALRTVCEALAKAAAIALELEIGEIQAEFRPALSSEGPSGGVAEVYLYDTLPGGAGFARQVGNRLIEIMRIAHKVLSACTCDFSCYKCLRSFRNKFEHDRLDRIVGADLLAMMLTGASPKLSEQRLSNAADQLAEDIARQGGNQVSVERDATFVDRTGAEVKVPVLVTGPDQRRLGIAVTHPLAANTPLDPSLGMLAEFGDQLAILCAHELRIRRALPVVTKDVLRALGFSVR